MMGAVCRHAVMALVAAVVAVAHVHGQTGPTPAPPLLVHLECAPCGETPVPDLGWVRWTPDSAAADVHVRVTREQEDSLRYAVTLAGQGRFAGMDAVMYHATTRDDLPAQVRSALIQTVTLGLVRFAAVTSMAPHIRVAYADPAAPPAERPARPAGTGQRQQAAQKRWAAGLDLGFSGSSGNSDFIALTSGVRLRHLQTNRFRLDWSATYRYGESGGDVAARHIQSKLDFDLGPGARVAPFISMSGERDPFRRIDLRGRGGTGVRLSVHKDDSGEASLRGAVLYTHERFRPETGLAPKSDGVWSLKFAGNRQLGSAVRVETSSSFDPALTEVSDYNFDVTSKLSTRITRRVALTLSHTYAYDSTPVQGVQSSDQRFQSGLTLDF